MELEVDADDVLPPGFHAPGEIPQFIVNHEGQVLHSYPMAGKSSIFALEVMELIMLPPALFALRKSN